MPRLKFIDNRNIVLDGQTVRYALKRSLKARHLRLEIRFKSGLTVVIPRRFDLDKIEPFLYQKEHWIIKKLADVSIFRARNQLLEPDYTFYLGRKLKVLRQCDLSKSVSVELGLDNIIINHGVNGDSSTLLKEWLIDKAKELIFMRVAQLNREIGVRYGRITIRDARTRWGSCSKLGNLNFNWRLIQIPEQVIDYVIIHELCHLKQMNHSSGFWKLIEKYCPDYLQHRIWLKEHEVDMLAWINSNTMYDNEKHE